MTRPEAELFPTDFQPGIGPRELARLRAIVSGFPLSFDGTGGDDGTEGSPEGLFPQKRRVPAAC